MFILGMRGDSDPQTSSEAQVKEAQALVSGPFHIINVPWGPSNGKKAPEGLS